MKIDHYINDGQDPKVVEKLLLKLQDMLPSDEAVAYIAVQKMPAVTLFPDSIALTNKRIFLCESTKLGLATDFRIFTWPAIREVAFKEKIIGSRFIILPKQEAPVEIMHIPKNQVRKLYQWANEMLEKQQNHDDSGDAAATDSAGPMFVNTPGQPQESTDELTLKLQKLKSLFEQQLITQAEYDNKKNELLSQL